MESSRALSVLMSGSPSDIQSAAYSSRYQRGPVSPTSWIAIWGDRSLEGSLSDCLDYMGIYGSARDFHMREARRTGRTGGDLWRVQLLSRQLAS